LYYIMEIYERLVDYIKLQRHSASWKEGYIDEYQINFFVDLLHEEEVKNIGEIGFNIGHSALTFLKNAKNSKVWSFDCNRHAYTMLGKEFIDNEYPERLHLICGDSTKTLPVFAENNTGFKFDLIFIDGGHSYKVAKSDIINMKKLANEDTIVIIDDIRPEVPWGKGPSKALNECIENGIIINVEYFDNSEKKGKITRRWVKANYCI
jgi:predicted O-methyltransferase YrrM